MLFDHLISAGENNLRDTQPESLGCFDIDDEVKFYRLLHGQVSRLCSPQDFIRKFRSTANRSIKFGPYEIRPPEATNYLKPEIVGIFAALAALMILSLLAFVRGSLYT